MRILRSWIRCFLAMAMLVVGAGCSVQEPPEEHPASSAALRASASARAIVATEDACNPTPAPVESRLVYLGPTQARYGDSLPLSALLTDALGQPLAERTVRFVLGTEAVTGVSDSRGIVQATLVPTQAPAELPLLVAYDGDASSSPASASATFLLLRADTVTRFEGPALLSSGTSQGVRARLLTANQQLPIAGRTLVFEAGGVRATATTDASGLAAASFTWRQDVTGPTTLRISFAGDAFYEPSSDESSITRYLPTAFAIWGGNTPGPQLGQRFNFWGHSWEDQVRGGDYDSQADFKGYASSLRAFALCQPEARTTGTPALTPGCWESKGGQSFPPAQLPEYIGVIISTSIAKERGSTYGNIAALGLLRVDPQPPYGPAPGKPGWGTLVAIIEGGPLFPPPVVLQASQRQPLYVLPGESFEVAVDIANPSATPAEAVAVTERFPNGTPGTGEQQVGTLPPQAQRTVVFSQRAPQVPPRAADEPEAAYQARLARADLLSLSSVGRVRYADPLGATPSALDLVSESLLRLPRLTVALSAPSCAGPCTTVAYTATVTNIGTGKAARATATFTLPDGSRQVAELGSLESRAIATRAVEWTLPDPGPRLPEESLEAYLERLQAFTRQALAASVTVTWEDNARNAYGPLERSVAPVGRISIPVATAEAPAQVLPSQRFALRFNVTNMGDLRADGVVLRLAETGAATAPLELAPGQTALTELEVTSPPVAPKGADEADESYLSRLVAANGSSLPYAYALEWRTACGGLLGPLPGRTQATRILPVLALSLQAPAEARLGDTITYLVTVHNAGQAEASSPQITLTLPGGESRALAVGALPPGARVQVPVQYTLVDRGTSGLAVASISALWGDAAGNLYGPLTAHASTRVQVDNLPPVVDAGPDLTVTLPDVALPLGDVTDDGLPQGAVLRSAWVQVSGPGEVWFADATQPRTLVSFTLPGTYVLRLTGNDSQLSASDEMVVTVLPRTGGGATLPGGTPSQGETLVNVVRDGNLIRLDDSTRAFNFIWVAVSTKGTVVKVDTTTGRVLGEYLTAPAGRPRDPSRTTVDKHGNVWAGNRASNTVVKFGLVENGQCEDRNGNGVIDTSTGLNDIRPWPNTGGADTLGGVSTAQDECILRYVRVNSSVIRHVSVDANNDVWVSGTTGRRFDLLDGDTGVLKRQENTVGYGGYGGLIDSQGVIWSAAPLLRWNTALPLSGPNGGSWRGYSTSSYGLCIAPDGSVWNTSHTGNTIYKYKPDGTLAGQYRHGNHYAQGCVVDRQGHVWVAHSLYRNTVAHLKPDGSLVGVITVGSGPTGVAVDGAGKIWATNYEGQTLSRIDPALGPKGPDGVTPVGAVDFTSERLGGKPYNYSDMTGSTLQGAPDRGTWTVAFDSGIASARWGKVAWTGRVCGDGVLTVQAASSADGTSYGPLVPVHSGEDFDVASGRHLRVTTSFQRSSKGESPVVYEMAWGTADYVLPAQVNRAPVVEAGPDRTVTYPNPVQLVGSACDDALPSAGRLALQWTQVSGPGTVSFSAPGQEITQAAFSAPGTYVLRLTASDSVLTGQDDVTLTVVPSNLPPEVKVDSPKVAAFPPGTVELTATVQDDGLPAGGAVTTTWAKVSGPGTVTFEDAARVPTLATFSAPGTYVVRLTASDGQLVRSQDVLVQVGGTPGNNQPPWVDAGPSWRLVLPTRTVQLKGSVTDDGLPSGGGLDITWSQVSGPAPTTFGNPRSLETSATFSEAGTYLLRLTVNDSQLQGSAELQVVVELAPPPNAPPRVSAGPDRLVAIPPGRTVLSGGVLDDGQPEGATVQVAWSKANGPGPVSFTTPGQPTTEVLFAEPGTYTLQLTANDTERTSSAAVRVEVKPDLVNAPPEVSASGPPVASMTEPVALSGSVYDEGLPATGVLTVVWSLVSGPGTASFTAPDRVATRATFSAPGEYVLRLTASDSELSAAAEVALRVVSGNQPPVVSAGEDQVAEGLTALLNGFVSDDGLPPGSIPTVQWSMVAGPGTVTFSAPSSAFTQATFSAPGTYVLRLTADDSGLSASDDVQVRALEPEVPLSTPGWIGAPVNGTSISGLVPITLGHGVTLVSGTLDFWPTDDRANVTVLAQQVSGTGGSTLATLDTTRLPNGTYVVRLRGTNAEGDTLASGVMVTVTGEYKPGRVSFTVTDLTVAVAGLPITIERSYDSLERLESKDFGHGWTLGLGNPDLEVGPANDVTLTLPNGRRSTFYFTPRSVGGVFGFLLRPEYTPGPGVYGTLTANGCGLLVSSGGRLVCFLDLPDYRPTLYVYTDPYGHVYEMGADGGMRSIRDPHGKTLTFSREGITSSAGGVQVRFERDARGRISRILDPAGNAYTYQYDAQGDLKTVTFPKPDEASPAPTVEYFYSARFPHLFERELDALGTSRAISTYYASPEDPPELDGRLKSLSTRRDASTVFTTRFEYDLEAGTVTTINPDGGRVVREYASRTLPRDGSSELSTELVRETEDVRVNAQGRVETRTTRYRYDGKSQLMAMALPDPETGEAASLASDPITCAPRNVCYAYDSRGNRTRVTNALGHAILVEYNTLNRPVRYTDQEGRVRHVQYDPMGNILSVSDEQGVIGGYTHDSRGNIASSYIGDDPSMASRYTYDELGNIASVQDPLGNLTTMSGFNLYGEPASQTVSASDGLGNTRTLQYQKSFNTLGHVTQAAISDESGQAVSATFQYDALGNLTATRDPSSGWGTTYDYYVDGKVREVTQTGSAPVRYTYTWRGELETVSSSSGSTARYEYDLAGQLIRVTEGSQPGAPPAQTFEYDLAGQLKGMTDAHGNRATLSYDAAGRPLELTDPVNGPLHPASLEYDDSTRILGSVLPSGTRNSLDYNTRGLPTRTVFAAGTPSAETLLMQYDARGQPTRRTDAVGTTAYEYNAASQLTAVTNPNQETTRFAHDGLGRLRRITDAKQQSTTFDYDALGRVTRRTWPDQSAETLAYAHVRPVNGNPADDVPVGPGAGLASAKSSSGGVLMRVAHTLLDGQVNYSYYDAQGNLVRQRFADGEVIEFGYNAEGQLTEVRDQRGLSCYAYDDLWRVVAVEQLGSGPGAACGSSPPRRRLAYTYDFNGYRTAITVTAGATSRTVGYAYDGAGRTCVIRAGSIPSSCEDTAGGYAYTFEDHVTDEPGIATRTVLTYPNGLVEKHAYDPNGRLISVTHHQNGALLASYTYTFDQAGRRLSQTELDGSRTSWSYDAASRLTQELRQDGAGTPLWDLRFEHDAVGNRLSVRDLVSGSTAVYTYRSNQLDQLASVTIDGTTQRSYSYDARGNLTSDGVATYTWNARDQLVSIRGPGFSRDYAYDVLGNLARETADGVDRAYLWDELSVYGDILGEFDERSGELVSSYTRNGIHLLEQTRGSAAHYLLRDGQGHTRALADTQTGGIVERYGYDAFGQLRTGPTAPATSYLYTGQRFDPASGLYFLRARFYNPADGRLLSRDTLPVDTSNPSQINRYVYGASNPVNGFDPTGKMFVEYVSTNRMSEEQHKKHVAYHSGVAPSQGMDAMALTAEGFLSAAADSLFVSVAWWTIRGLELWGGHADSPWSINKRVTMGLGTVFHLKYAQKRPRLTISKAITVNAAPSNGYCQWGQVARQIRCPALPDITGKVLREALAGILRALVLATSPKSEVVALNKVGSSPWDAHAQTVFGQEWKKAHAEILIARWALNEFAGPPTPHRMLDIVSSRPACSDGSYGKSHNHLACAAVMPRLALVHPLLFERTFPVGLPWR